MPKTMVPPVFVKGVTHLTLRELKHLRSILIYHLRVFEGLNPEDGMAARLFIATTLHAFIDEMAIAAAEQYLWPKLSLEDQIHGIRQGWVTAQALSEAPWLHPLENMSRFSATHPETPHEQSNDSTLRPHLADPVFVFSAQPSRLCRRTRSRSTPSIMKIHQARDLP